jgi:hypothetical protein
LERVVEGVADAEEPLAVGLQEDRRVTWRVAGGADGVDAGQELCIVFERAQLLAEQADRFARSFDMRLS